LRRKNNSSFGVLAVFALFLVGALYVYFSATFERNLPIVEMQTNGYWNLKKPLHIEISDDTGLKSYKVFIKFENDKKELAYEMLETPQESVILNLKAPRSVLVTKEKDIKVIVEATDASKWNFFSGNRIVKKFNLVIDKKRPKLNIVANSYGISRGGSALVVFQVKDENIDELYIIGNNGKKFIPQPFYRDGFYISLMAWPVQDRSFKASVVATDYAGNKAKEYIPLYLKQKKYRVSKIKISDRFLKGKIADLAEELDETQGVENSLEQFKIINEDVRAKNEKFIHELTSVINTEEEIDNFSVNKMYPLKNAKVVAHFGDHRKYYYKGSYISQSYHLGLDLASNAMSSIKTQNDGKVVFADFNGLYGNMPAISYGLGLYTIYGHCSSIKVNSGDEVQKNEVIANTGKSGYAMGDHLHFGVLVQGVEVRPQEWMDKQWIRLNITDVIKSAKKIIDRD
jgi:murein DD-endopeptidase MepM/ murein hydrolase activator NlpD